MDSEYLHMQMYEYFYKFKNYIYIIVKVVHKRHCKN